MQIFYCRVFVNVHCKFFTFLFTAGLLILMYDLIVENVKPDLYISATTQETSSQNQVQYVRYCNILLIYCILNTIYFFWKLFMIAITSYSDMWSYVNDFSRQNRYFAKLFCFSSKTWYYDWN